MNDVVSPPASLKPPKRKWRSWWVRQLHSWHWISAAISLAAMLFFAVTGITLNHAASISATPSVTERKGDLPPSLVRTLQALPMPEKADAPLPPSIAAAVREVVGLDAGGRPADWSESEVYVALPRAGGDAWVSIDRASGHISAEITDRGWISYFNDLHKGRNTGDAWFWFIDVFAVACVVFTLTGLFLLQVHARHRRATWPTVLTGIAIPVLLAILFIH